MRANAAVFLLVQLALLSYSLWAVHHRLDRRRLENNVLQAFHGMAAFAVAVMAIAFALDAASEGRRFLFVRELWEYALMAVAAAVALAVHLLRGATHRAPLDTNRNGNSER